MAYAQRKVSSQVKREIPKRLLLLPAWNYHGYKSMMSNEDVKDYIFSSLARTRHKPMPSPG